MIDLLLVLTPISLIDSTSMLPFGVVVISVLLGGSKPYTSAGAFTLGVCVTYFAAGMLIVFGLQHVIEAASGWLIHWWKNPDTLDHVLGITVGSLLVFFGYRLIAARQKRVAQKTAKVSTGMTPWQALALGAGSAIAGIWGALPYFAAIDQIFKANVSTVEAVAALAYYNLIFVLPLVVLVLIRAVVGDRAAGIFDAVNRWFSVWGKRALAAALVLVGLVMIADSIGWLLGRPLIPV